jgi:tetratricopeptide (TPR) repeat protein
LYAATQKQDIAGQLQAIQQIAEHYLKVERPKRALSYYRLGLETDSSELGKAKLLRQIAQVHLDMGELHHAQQFVQESIRILKVQSKLKGENKAPAELSASLITMAYIRIEGLDFYQAQEDINEAFRLSRAAKDDTLISQSYQALVRLREKQGNVEGTKTVLLEWAQSQKERVNKAVQTAALAQANSTTAVSLCEKNWKENNFAGALKAARSGVVLQANQHAKSGKQQTASEAQPPVALELCKAKSLIKLNRHQELLADYAKLPSNHPLAQDPSMLLLVSRSLMGIEQYAKAISASLSALQTLGNPTQDNEVTSNLRFALVENLILIELQSPSTPASGNLLNLCGQAEQISSNNNSPIWSECALVSASEGKFEKALKYTQWAELWFAEFGTFQQRIENRLIKALIQVELGEVDEGLLSVNAAILQIEKAKAEGAAPLPSSSNEPNTENWITFERKTNEVLGLAASKKGERDRAVNFYKLALNAAHAENNESEMERLTLKLAALNKTEGRAPEQSNSKTHADSKNNPLSRIQTWFEQLRTPEYLRSLNPFKKRSE